VSRVAVGARVTVIVGLAAACGGSSVAVDPGYEAAMERMRVAAAELCEVWARQLESGDVVGYHRVRDEVTSHLDGGERAGALAQAARECPDARDGFLDADRANREARRPG
jgi:hypothetical protein